MEVLGAESCQGAHLRKTEPFQVFEFMQKRQPAVSKVTIPLVFFALLSFLFVQRDATLEAALVIFYYP